MAEILTPRCPLCDQLPGMAFGEQAFCANDDCTILCWTLTLSLDENLMDAGHIRLEPTEGNGDAVP